MEGQPLVNGCHGTAADHGTDSDVEERLEMEMQQQASSSAHSQQQREVSGMLGEKMLQGWTLLGDTCPRCSTILVRNRDRELFCVSCDMFLRPEQQAATSTPPAAPQTPAQEPPAQTGQPEQAVHEEEAHNSSGQEEAEAEAPLEQRDASCAHRPDRVLGLMMETMELFAWQLKRDISSGDCEEGAFEGLLNNIEYVAKTYHSVRTKCG